MPQGTDLLNPHLPSSHPPTFAPDNVTGKVTSPSSSLVPPVPWVLACPYSYPQGTETILSSFSPYQTQLYLLRGPLRFGV
jgi:hypothetical protein